MYDPIIGRMRAIDLKAELMPSHSPLSFCFNNPIRFTDPTGMVPGEYYNEQGTKIGDDGKKDNKVFVVKTTQSTDALYQGTTNKGVSNPITQEAAATTENEIRNGNFSGEHMKNLVQVLSPANMENLSNIASKDDGTGGTKPENNREYGATISGGKVKEGKPGPVVDPSVGVNGSYTSILGKGDVDMHTHPSGTKRVILNANSSGTARFGGTYQPPSSADISGSNSRVNYVFGMRDGTIYMYNNKGVIATVPISTFKKP